MGKAVFEERKETKMYGPQPKIKKAKFAQH